MMCGHVRETACRNNLLVASPPPARNLFRCVEAEGEGEGEGEDRDEAERNCRPHFSPHKKAYGITSFAGIRVSSGSVSSSSRTHLFHRIYADKTAMSISYAFLFALCSTLRVAGPPRPVLRPRIQNPPPSPSCR